MVDLEELPHASQGARAKPKFIGHLHAFRGIAIMLIVLVHTAGASMYRLGTDPDMSDYMWLWSIFETIAHNGTIFFALISGLLYATVLAGRGWFAFFRSKLLNVILPYALFTILFTAIGFSIIGGIEIYSGSRADFIPLAIQNFGAGEASIHFWYIPVLTALFVLTPAITWLFRKSWGVWPLVAILLLPLVLSRSFDPYSLENVAVFLAPYAFGIWLGFDYDNRISLLARFRKLLLGIVLLTSVVTTVLVHEYVGPMVISGDEWAGPINWYESISYVQKMALACLILFWLKSRPDWLPRWLDYLATYAFAIYFMHIAIFVSLIELLLAAGVRIELVWSYLLTIPILWIATMAICLGLAMLLRKLLGRRSRMVIGA